MSHTERTDAHLVGPEERLEAADHRVARERGDRQPGVPVAVEDGAGRYEVFVIRTTVQAVRHVVRADGAEAAVAAARAASAGLGPAEEVTSTDQVYAWDTAQVYGLREASAHALPEGPENEALQGCGRHWVDRVQPRPGDTGTGRAGVTLWRLVRTPRVREACDGRPRRTTVVVVGLVPQL